MSVLGVGREVSVRYLTTQDVDAQPADMAVALDTLLRAQPLAPPRLSLQRKTHSR